MESRIILSQLHFLLFKYNTLPSLKIVSSKHLPTCLSHPPSLPWLFYKEVSAQRTKSVTGLQPSPEGSEGCLRHISFMYSWLFCFSFWQWITAAIENYILVFTKQLHVIVHVLYPAIQDNTPQPWTIYSLLETQPTKHRTKTPSSWESHSHLRGE